MENPSFKSMEGKGTKLGFTAFSKLFTEKKQKKNIFKNFFQICCKYERIP